MEYKSAKKRSVKRSYKRKFTKKVKSLKMSVKRSYKKKSIKKRSVKRSHKTSKQKSAKKRSKPKLVYINKKINSGKTNSSRYKVIYGNPSIRYVKYFQNRTSATKFVENTKTKYKVYSFLSY